MPPADKNFTFYQIPLPPAYRRLARRTRLMIELGVGGLLLVLFAVATSVQTPLWLQIAGWSSIAVYWMVCIVLYLRRWGQRQARGIQAQRRFHPR